MTRITLALLLALSLSSSAAGATLVTPPIDIAAGAEASCAVQNLDTKVHLVTARMFHGDGELADEDPDLVIPARRATQVLTRSDPSTGVFCEFEGLSKKVRAYIAVRVGGTTQFVLPAAK